MVAGNICQVEGCTNILKKTEGRICQKHRSRMFRHGSYDLLPNWRTLKKGKPSLTTAGYMRINIDGKRVLQHRHIMEQHLGRPLGKKERIHHINGDRADNRIENLELMSSNADHMKKYHANMWERRIKNGPLSVETIHQIVDRVHIPACTHTICFCGKPIMARNLCDNHYQWAYKHRIFRPRKYRE